jgi:uncharacterized protein
MTPQEQQLITELFARLKQTPPQAKDADADQLIRKAVMGNPEAPYLLVQTALIQDMALSQAQHRVADLEQQLGEAKAASSPQPSQPTSFLGGLLSRHGAPPVGASDRPSQPTAPTPQPSPAAPAATPAPFESAGASSGFLRGAAATALGVMGGQMLFQGIQSMFGQHAGSILGGQSMRPPLSETVVNNFYGDQPSPQDAQASADDPDAQDIGDDPTLADGDSDEDAGDQDLDGDDDSFDGSDTDLT